MPNSGIQDSLRERGVRLTRQRHILPESIDHSGLHLDAGSLYQLAKEKDPKLNRVTVYRSLKLFKEGGLVDELGLMHHSGDPHDYETRLKQQRAQVICLMESHVGFEVASRTEIGAYFPHCRALRAQESNTESAAGVR